MTENKPKPRKYLCDVCDDAFEATHMHFESDPYWICYDCLENKKVEEEYPE